MIRKGKGRAKKTTVSLLRSAVGGTLLSRRFIRGLSGVGPRRPTKAGHHPRRAGRPPSKEAGFSLMEIIVSTLVFSLGIVGVVTLQTWTLKGTAIAAEISLATNLASSTLERLMIELYANLVPRVDYYEKSGEATQPNDQRYFTVEITVTRSAVPEYKDINVNVTWRYSLTEGYYEDNSGNRAGEAHWHEVTVNGRVFPR